MKLGDVFTSVSLAIGSYRHGVSSTIPAMTRVAWQIKKSEIIKDAPGATLRIPMMPISHSDLMPIRSERKRRRTLSL